MEQQNTMEKIEKGAIEEFSMYGFDGARIDRIAEKAGINKAMIYYHFKGKEALYEYILHKIVSGLYNTVEKLIPEDPRTRMDFENLFRGYSTYLGHIDENYIRIMLREIATGGKYFKKITVPVLLIPVISRFTSMFKRGQENGLVKDLNPVYTMLQMIGSVVFFNMFRTTMKDTPLADIVFKDDFINLYTENMLRVIAGGIFTDER